MKRFYTILSVLLSLNYWVSFSAGQDADDVDPDEAETVGMADVNGDGVVDADDLTLVTDNLDSGDNAPAIGEVGSNNP